MAFLSILSGCGCCGSCGTQLFCLANPLPLTARFTQSGRPFFAGSGPIVLTLQCTPAILVSPPIGTPFPNIFTYWGTFRQPSTGRLYYLFVVNNPPSGIALGATLPGGADTVGGAPSLLVGWPAPGVHLAEGNPNTCSPFSLTYTGLSIFGLPNPPATLIGI